MAEPETDIASSAIMWLCDDPTFNAAEGAEMIRVALKALGAEDPEDPLLVALVIEGIAAQRGTIPPALAPGWQPELCGDDANRRVCNEPVSGTGRCMTCGSQRLEPEKPSAAIKAAQMSDKEPDIYVVNSEDLQPVAWPPEDLLVDEGTYIRPLHEAVEAHEKALAEEPRIIHSGPAEVPHRFNKPRRLKRKAIIKAHIHLDAPSPSAIEKVKLRVLEGVRPDMPLMHRLKQVTGLSDQELGDILGRSRATIQAYAQSNRNEVLGPNQLQALADMLRSHYDVLADLLLELEALQCPSEK